MLRAMKHLNNNHLVFVTRQGLVKRTKEAEFKNIRQNGLIALKLREGDELINVFLTTGNEEIVIGTKFVTVYASKRTLFEA